MSDVAGERVALDVHGPLKAVDVGMACAYVFSLQMLELRVDVEAITGLSERGGEKGERRWENDQLEMHIIIRRNKAR